MRQTSMGEKVHADGHAANLGVFGSHGVGEQRIDGERISGCQGVGEEAANCRLCLDYPRISVGNV